MLLVEYRSDFCMFEINIHQLQKLTFNMLERRGRVSPVVGC